MTGWFGALASLILAAALSGQARAESCPYERAQYVLQGDANVIAGFLRHKPIKGIQGDVFLFVAVKSNQLTYWFFPESGNGYGSISLISTIDATLPFWQPPNPDSRRGRPYADQKYYALNSDLTFRDEMPASGKPAPPLFLIPELAPAVWYDYRTLAEGRYRMPRAFFRFHHCAD